MGTFIAIIVTLAVVAVVVILATRIFDTYIDGLLDGEYPTVARGDCREGIWRTLYLIGRAKGERNVTIREQRERLTRERRDS